MSSRIAMGAACKAPLEAKVVNLLNEASGQ